jgi:methylamine dehydrogenase heavy chain
MLALGLNLGRLGFLLGGILLLPSLALGSTEKNTSVNESIPPLAIEPTGQVKTLPSKYPSSWFWAQDVAFGHMLDGKMVLLDVAAETLPKQYKGSFNVSIIGNIVQAEIRNEIYATETFYSRGVRGERTDVVTIWSKDTLEPIAEIVWPKLNRFMGLPEKNALQLIDDEKLLLVFNLNPATSVTVIDVESRKIINEIATPGCALIYPTGKRGFSSVCSNGGLLSTQLKANGQIASQKRVKPFFSSDTSPIFEHTVIIDGIAYFPSYEGLMQKVDLRGDIAKPMGSWSMVSAKEKAANWRPGGLGLIDKDDQGNIYIIMHPDGHDGSQQHGGTEIWVFDSKQEKRIARYPVQSWAISIGVGRGENPLLVLTNGDLLLEVYDAHNGEFIRTIDAALETPLMIHAAH